MQTHSSICSLPSLHRQNEPKSPTTLKITDLRHREQCRTPPHIWNAQMGIPAITSRFNTLPADSRFGLFLPCSSVAIILRQWLFSPWKTNRSTNVQAPSISHHGSTNMEDSVRSCVTPSSNRPKNQQPNLMFTNSISLHFDLHVIWKRNETYQMTQTVINPSTANSKWMWFSVIIKCWL